MAYEMKEGFGSLFKTDKKGNEKAPDYSGSVMIGGNIYQVAGWKKQTKGGDTYLSLSAKVKAPENNQAGAPQPAKPSTNVQKDPFADFPDDLPF